MKIHNFKYLLLASLAFASCSEEIEEEVVSEVQVTAGTANFSKYVALGNSLTAGFSDGALFKEGQANSYAKLLADQFASVGGGTFKIPYTNDNRGGLLASGVVITGNRLVFSNGAPTALTGTPTTEIGVPLAGPFNNLGVPGAKVFHLLAPGYGNIAGLGTTANPYFIRFRSAAATTILADAMAQQPTFFSLWIGNNDVLSYATSGGTGVDRTGNPNPATYGPNDITDPTLFANVYNTLLDGTNGLTKNGAKGVVANIPSVTALPFFTTVPFNPITARILGQGLLPNGTADQQTAAGTTAMNQLNSQLLGPLDQILTALGQPDRIQLLNSTGINPLLIVDESLTNLGTQIQTIAANSGNPQLVALAPFLGSVYGQARHSTKDDLVLLTTRPVIGQSAGSPVSSLNAFGVSFPLQDQHLLVPTEIGMIRTATTAFNNTIKTAATAKGLAFVDAAAIMTQAATTGIRFGTFSMNASFVTGGVFGLDGIHLTARANAYAANKFLEAIETTYGAKFKKYGPELFPLSYPASLPN